MIPTEKITENQKEFLSQHYGIDIEERARFWRKKFRKEIKVCPVILLLAAALYWEGTSEFMTLYWKPVGGSWLGAFSALDSQ